ncbi:hypothetical protein [Paraliobacillus zengyii]|uniref:hypothetical protein n=1 Tax=Paraliobacillus zengyii TaxID=2213194 RepID=UPI000DD38EE6|nr:hypothetical protein [Paraliobacillus zengyii]
MLKRWEVMSKWRKICFVSSLIFLAVGVVWLIIALSFGKFSFFKSQSTFYIILGIAIALSTEMGVNKDTENK